MTPVDPDRLTYADATPEQVAEVRDRVRRRLAEARERYNPAYWAELRARLGLPARTG